MSAEPTYRDPFEVLASDFLERCRRGERPRVEDYVARFPDHAGEIRDLFPALEALEAARSLVGSGGGDDDEATPPPDRFGDFRLVAEIGRGGMGIVYEAVQESLGRPVAIKILPVRFAGEEGHERFRREAQAAANLHHTNLVPVLATGEVDDRPFYVMPRIDGIPLDLAIARMSGREDGDGASEAEDAALAHLTGAGPADSFRRLARVAADIARALHHAHERGILHRDVKPGNILVDAEGVARITDFGLACCSDGDDRLTRTGAVAGTLRYLAPERFKGRIGPGSDVYGLGATLYEALALVPFHETTDPSHLLELVASAEPRAPRRIRPEIPRDLETIVLKAIAREPDRRYRSASDLADDLEAWLEGRPIRARRVLPFERLWLWGRRHPVEAGLSAAVLVLLVSVAATSNHALATSRAAQAELREVYDREREARDRAEATSSIAVETLDRVFERFAPQRRFSEGSPQTSSESEFPAQPVLSRDAARMLEELIPIYDRLGQDLSLREKAAESRLRVAWIRHRLGQGELARDSYRRALDLIARLEEMDGRARVLDRVRALDGLARVTRELGDPDSAAALFDEARALLSGAGGRSSSLEWQLEHVTILLHEIGLERPDASSAGPDRRPETDHTVTAALLDEAFRVLEACDAEHPGDPGCRYLRAIALRERSGHRSMTGERGGREDIEEAVAILEELVRDHPGAYDYRYELARTLARVDSRARGPEAIEIGIERLARAIEILGPLAEEHPEETLLAAELAHALHVYGRLLDRARRREVGRQARDAHERAVDVQSSLVRRLPDSLPTALWLVRYREGLIDHVDGSLGHADPAFASELADRNVEFLESRLAEDPDLVGPQLDRARERLERIRRPR